MAEITKEQRREISNKAVGDFTNRLHGKFLSMRLKGRFQWPSEFTQLRLFDRDWLLWPNTEWDKPGLIIHCPSGDGKEEGKLALRFLSALAWVHGNPIQDEGFWTTGSHANPCFRDERETHYSCFAGRGLQIDEYDYLPFPEDEKAQIALALYREAVNVDNEAYKFLSFFKILNIEMNGPKQIAWINSKIDDVKDHQAKEQIAKLKALHADVGQHLYGSGRCAIAHANSNPIINPDNPDDRWRLRDELPIIKGLAELMIEQEFGIKSSTTIWREHLYELSGFKEVLGVSLIEHIAEGYDFPESGTSVPELIQSCLPKFSIRLRGEKEKPFENLTARIVKYEQGRFWLGCSAEDKLSSAILLIDIAKERIGDEGSNYLDIIHGLNCYDDGSAKAAVREAERNRFIKKLFENAVLEVWSEDGKLLGRKDAYLPVNIDPNRTHENYKRAAQYYDNLAVQRTLGIGQEEKTGFKRLLSTTTLANN